MQNGHFAQVVPQQPFSQRHVRGAITAPNSVYPVDKRVDVPTDSASKDESAIKQILGALTRRGIPPIRVLLVAVDPVVCPQGPICKHPASKDLPTYLSGELCRMWANSRDRKEKENLASRINSLKTHLDRDGCPLCNAFAVMWEAQARNQLRPWSFD